MNAIYHILYFGLLAERRGVAEESVESAACDPSAVYQEINSRHPLGMAFADIRAAVNDEFVSRDHPLKDGDRLAFLPPMSGG
ncbi:MAG: MoaD/ThiS family protein [Verrucomicrobiota bacterium]